MSFRNKFWCCNSTVDFPVVLQHKDKLEVMFDENQETSPDQKGGWEELNSNNCGYGERVSEARARTEQIW